MSNWRYDVNINLVIWRNGCSKMAGNTEDGLISTGDRIAGQTLWQLVQFWREICGKVVGGSCRLQCALPMLQSSVQNPIYFYSKTNRTHQCIKFIYFLFLEWNSTCFGRSFCPSSGVQDCTYSNTHMSSRQQYLFDIWLLLYVKSLTPDDGRKYRPKHVECHSKIK
jgi:hypothetical protein